MRNYTTNLTTRRLTASEAVSMFRAEDFAANLIARSGDLSAPINPGNYAPAMLSVYQTTDGAFVGWLRTDNKLGGCTYGDYSFITEDRDAISGLFQRAIRLSWKRINPNFLDEVVGQMVPTRNDLEVFPEAYAA